MNAPALRVVSNDNVDPALSLVLPAEEFIRALRCVSPWASTDTTRPHLNGVLVESVVGAGVRVVATNGHALAKYTLLSSGPAFKALIPLDAVAATLKARPKSGDIVVTSSSISWLASHVFGAPVHQGGSVTFAVSGETFPPYLKVIPDYSAEDRLFVGSIGACAEYIEKIGKSFRLLPVQKGEPGMKITFGPSELDPMVFEVPDFLIVLMPQRL